ncbi:MULTISPECIES: sensor histidine kinase [Corynebacterium]|uniref:sensor histidine kinase n=1 Tax=Corynebacterium TaxID=1716 RepID=UPI00068E4C6F|nr:MULTISPECIES: histidine kinase [Corynebacterium]OFT89279.1 hypothetical protein HMPREF3098_06035 [Corynebacterium sp. HMSC28B08]WJY73841.1 Sensor histidine kinase DesK [Corynebacterium auriscanis]
MHRVEMIDVARQKFVRPKWTYFLFSTGLILIGLILQMWGTGEVLDEFTNAHRDVPIGYGFYMVAQFMAFIAAVIVFPIALRHDPRELTQPHTDPQRVFAGPRWAMIANVVLAALAFSSGAAPFIFAAAISLAARPLSKWTWMAAGAFFVSASADLYLSWSPATSESLLDKDLWYILGYLCAPLLVLSPAVFIGLHRGRARTEWWHLMEEARFSSEHIDQQRHLAQREERTRIARDMHDSLSHRLSLIAVHSGALAFRDNLDATSVRQTATTIREQAEAAVEELKTVLTALHEDGPQDVDPRLDLEQLVEQARAAGNSIALDISDAPDPSELDTLATHALHRVVQECLTNARKHAPGQTVSITARRRSDHGQWFFLQLSNPLPLNNSANRASFLSDSAHLGLTGLAERVKLSGGSFETRVNAGQFTVEVRLPLASDKKLSTATKKDA